MRRRNASHPPYITMYFDIRIYMLFVSNRILLREHHHAKIPFKSDGACASYISFRLLITSLSHRITIQLQLPGKSRLIFKIPLTILFPKVLGCVSLPEDFVRMHVI